MKIKYKNILWSPSNITQRLTDSRKIILFISGIILSSSAIILPTSAESFQSSQSLSFTLNPTISITVSGDLSIESLTPGDYKDSNIITVTATSNAIAGYTLSGTVGNSTHSSPSFNNTNLNHTNGTNTFTNLSTNKTSLSDFDENSNTWGYSWCSGTCSTSTETTSWVSGNVGSTTQGYNGLPLYTTDSPTQFINSTSSDSSTISFKIGARSTTTQIAGEYTNVINFIGVANPNPPIVYMQSATLADCGKDMVDIRDNNVYSTTLVEDTCWMTTNLNLAGDTVLSSNDTDFTSDYYPNLPNDNGWTIVDNNKLKMPSSSTEGFSVDNYAYVYNSGNISSSCTAPGCYSYYSWDAATLGSGRSITADNTDAPHSICPAGWHLPNTRTGTNAGSDFRNLMIVLGGSNTIETYNNNTTPTGAEMYNRITSAPLNFLRAGYYNASTFGHGENFGNYWSATSNNGAYARRLNFNSTNVYSADYYYRRRGFSVRCVKSP